MDPKITSTVWKENVKIADENNQPGKFTAFCSYEWTSMPGNRNLHRNVFFRACDKVPDYPFSALDSKLPTELWNWMDAQRKSGNELLAISHNANVSDGWMYPVDVDNTTGRPIDAAWAAARDRNERLVEIKQGKGQSETHPLLSPNDEFASYELYQAILGLPADVGRIDHIAGSYGRQALKDGITMQDVRGYNPYKFGMAGGSDSHNTGSPYRQDNFFGLHADADGTVERRFAGVLIGGTMDVRLENPGGLTGVWAEENTRASLWDAMYRKETFGVSGPHIKVRFFGGWGYDKDILNAGDWVKQSYAGGVPMGADLPPMPSGGKGTAPSFVVWAVKDPTSANLDRIQVIKGWTQNGQSFEKIFDVAWSGDRKPDKWTRPGAGHPEHGGPREGHLHQRRRRGGAQDGVDRSGVRREPARLLLRARAGDSHAALDADPGREVRAAAARRRAAHGAGARLELADLVHAVGRGAQERSGGHDRHRAEEEGRQRAERRAAEGAHRRQGLLAAQQRDGRAVQPDLHGRRTDDRVPRRSETPSCRAPTATSMRDGYQGTTTAYKIEGGKLVTPVSQEPYAFTFYKLGDTYYAARSNEFGYANYEIIPAPQIAANPLTALSNQFSIELGLTEEQKKQIVPILEQEIKQLRATEEGHLAQRPAEGGGVAQARRLLRREDLAAAQSGAAAEVPGHARADAAADDRGDGRQGAAEGGIGGVSVVRRRAQVALKRLDSESEWIRRSGSGCLPCPRPGAEPRHG